MNEQFFLQHKIHEDRRQNQVYSKCVVPNVPLPHSLPLPFKWHLKVCQPTEMDDNPD